MDIKALNEAKKILEERKTHSLEKIENAKQKLMQNQQYSDLIKQIKLNTLQLSRALATDNNYAEFEEKDILLNKKLQALEKEFLGETDFYYCPKCKDSGILNDKYCDCLMTVYKQVLRNKSGVNALPTFTFKDNKIANINCLQSTNLSKLYSSMQSYCNDFPVNKYKNIMLCGKVGVGKSCLLSATLNELLDKGIDCIYLTAFHLNSLFLKYHTTNIKEREHILNNLINADVLIIDDLGIEPLIKNVTIEYLTVLLSERVNKHNIIATNLTFNEIQDKYGDRVFSRLTNQNNTKVLYLDGDDLRHINKN